MCRVGTGPADPTAGDRDGSHHSGFKLSKQPLTHVLQFVSPPQLPLVVTSPACAVSEPADPTAGDRDGSQHLPHWQACPSLEAPFKLLFVAALPSLD
jgi:hypothetical protein